jgi:beta-galactosidase
MRYGSIKAAIVCLALAAVLAGNASNGICGESRLIINLNPVWRFHLGPLPVEPVAMDFDDSGWDIVSLPHSEQVFDAKLSGFKEGGRSVGWYRRALDIPDQWLGRKKVFLEFRGVMQTTRLWVNGKHAGAYAVSGFDSFDFDITDYVKQGRNMIAVEVDDRVNRDTPPDGRTMDYILFGGIYRDVFLHATDLMHLTFPWEGRQAGVRLTLPEVSEKLARVQVESTVRNGSASAQNCVLVTEIRDRAGNVVQTMQQEREIAAGAQETFAETSEPLANPHLWSPDDPYLYKVITLVRGGDLELDRTETPLGIRWVKFDKQTGFFLNGQHLKLIGANYHQSWPFIGNAVPDGLHRRDAEQIKSMGVNWVRLSHYPHAPDFLDALDELGIMALEEPPTWALPGGDAWMANLESSFRSMIRRDRNHPSIVIWGACINHRPAEPRLVQAAVQEDPGRERGQDTVPTPMGFTPLQISGERALTIEHTGHTFPAQRGAREMIFRIPGGGVETEMNREYHQAKRHWEQVNAAYLKEDNSGLAVWCMYDYNTFHNTSEPGMVWHGVCDLFRIPKFSYWWHMSELTSKPMAYVVRIDNTRAAIFSNCEKILLWEDTGHGYSEVGTKLPEKAFTTPDGPTMQYALHHPPFQFAVSPNAEALKAEGSIGGIVQAVYEWKKFGTAVKLKLEADREEIAADGADLSRIIVTAVDTNGTPVDTSKVVVAFSIDGLGQLIGENPLKLRAGKMIILAQSGFVPGDLVIRAKSDGLGESKVTVKMNPLPANVDLPKNLPAKQPTKRTLVSTHYLP